MDDRSTYENPQRPAPQGKSRGEEILEFAGLDFSTCSDGDFRGRPGAAHASINHFVVGLFHRHPGPEIRQTPGAPGDHRVDAGDVEREEPDTGPATRPGHVRPYVCLRDRAQ